MFYLKKYKNERMYPWNDTFLNTGLSKTCLQILIQIPGMSGYSIDVEALRTAQQQQNSSVTSSDTSQNQKSDATSSPSTESSPRYEPIQYFSVGNAFSQKSWKKLFIKEGMHQYFEFYVKTYGTLSMGVFSRKYCGVTQEYWANTWKMCSLASATFASIVKILVSFEAILIYSKACGKSLLWKWLLLKLILTENLFK